MALNRSLSHKEGRLIQRITPFVDLNGFGWAHLSRDFLHRSKLTITALLHAYPDSTCGFYIVNAPSLFTLLWKFVRPLLDDETASMVRVLGGPSAYTPVLREMGITIDGGGDLETCPASWRNAMKEVAPHGRKPPAYLSPADSEAFQSAMVAVGLRLRTHTSHSSSAHSSTLRAQASSSRGRSTHASTGSHEPPSLAEALAQKGAGLLEGRLSPSSVLVQSIVRRSSSDPFAHEAKSGAGDELPFVEATPTTAAVLFAPGLPSAPVALAPALTHDAPLGHRPSQRPSDQTAVEVAAAGQPTPTGQRPRMVTLACAAGVAGAAVALLARD